MTIIYPGDPDCPPDEVIKAAHLVGNYFASKTNGYWACGPVCSRFHPNPELKLTPKDDTNERVFYSGRFPIERD